MLHMGGVEPTRFSKHLACVRSIASNHNHQATGAPTGGARIKRFCLNLLWDKVALLIVLLIVVCAYIVVVASPSGNFFKPYPKPSPVSPVNVTDSA